MRAYTGYKIEGAGTSAIDCECVGWIPQFGWGRRSGGRSERVICAKFINKWDVGSLLAVSNITTSKKIVRMWSCLYTHSTTAPYRRSRLVVWLARRFETSRKCKNTTKRVVCGDLMMWNYLFHLFRSIPVGLPGWMDGWIQGIVWRSVYTCTLNSLYTHGCYLVPPGTHHTVVLYYYYIIQGSVGRILGIRSHRKYVHWC